MKRLQILTIIIITCFVSIFPFCLLAKKSSPSQYLKVHNDARAIVGVKPLMWNNNLKSRAEKFVHDHRVDCLDDITLEDPPPEDGPLYGESFGRIPAEKHEGGVNVVKEWVEKKKNYDYSSNTCIGGRSVEDDCLLYVQMVTNGSTRLGCASAMCQDNQDIIVACYYYPEENDKYVSEAKREWNYESSSYHSKNAWALNMFVYLSYLYHYTWRLWS
ncbi:hypothetical protein PIB30_051992 [Stylosanthes scabra]|uniref:SCP domain-containing protein n=1 Tax=Stylosanthes scabra TaxID=79078 RepID=A0ABU6SHY3_9FABA|nr:hypothetical protein [Stylosanthes scabra]